MSHRTSWTAYVDPDAVKLLVGLLLFGMFSIVSPGICVEGGTLFGFPFIFYSQCNEADGVTPGQVRFNVLALIVDLTLWYVVAAILVTVFRLSRGAPND